MIRLFEQHNVRYEKELEGYWDFTAIESWELPIKYAEKMYVPSCIENDIRYKAYRGKVAYKKVLCLKEIGHYRLLFKGVSHTALVFINGRLVKQHYNAYTAFEVLFETEKSDTIVIEVLVSNEFTSDSALHIPNDYYTYGGIIKPVVLEKINSDYINNIQWTTQLVDRSWHIKLQIALKHIAENHEVLNRITDKITNSQSKNPWKEKNLEKNLQKRLRIFLDDVLLEQQASDFRLECERSDDCVKESNGEVFYVTYQWSESIDKRMPWTHQNPKLYMLKLELLDETLQYRVDDLIERIGFRDIQVKSKHLLLNGEALFLQGFNRHEDYNSFGCALPTQAMAIDLALMKDLACNTVRTSHYPNDERFLDMCDELGILVWEENHARGLSLENMQHVNFDEQCKNCNEAMVIQHFNHPSIIIWGILNECASHTIEGRDKYAMQLRQIRSMDPSRPLTYASCQHFTDICFDLVDIVSTNIYFGWYDESCNEEEIRQEFDKQLQWIISANGENKPLIISEFGAGALYGYRAPHAPKWSEERQAKILRDTLTIYQNHRDVSGTYIWQFCDVRVTEEEWAIKRPRSMNNKGIVDEYRRPKLAYEVVKEMHRKNKKK